MSVHDEAVFDQLLWHRKWACTHLSREVVFYLSFFTALAVISHTAKAGVTQELNLFFLSPISFTGISFCVAVC